MAAIVHHPLIADDEAILLGEVVHLGSRIRVGN
jgi:hypothetical protein